MGTDNVSLLSTSETFALKPLVISIGNVVIIVMTSTHGDNKVSRMLSESGYENTRFAAVDCFTGI